MTEYSTPIGTMRLETNWPALDLAVRKRCGWPTPPARTFDVIAHRTADLPDDGLLIMDARVRCEHDQIEAFIPDPSFMAGAVLDWLWLAIPQWCAPEGWDLLHAAAVTEGDGVTLIIGPSGSGKTTALLAFLDQGAQFLADDAVLVNRETGAVIPWGMNLHLDVAMVGERWPELLPATVDFNAKVRLSPQSLGYEASEGGCLKRAVILAAKDDSFSLRHSGIGFSEAPAADDMAMLEALAEIDWWGYRVPDIAEKIAVEFRPICPSFAAVTLFSGKTEALGRWIEHFLALNLPTDAHLLWLCNSSDEEFWAALHEAAALLTPTYPNLQVWRDAHRVGQKDAQVAYLYQQARTRVPDGSQFVLTLEDDVLPDAGAFWTMLAEWARRGGRDVVGVPVPHTYQHGAVTALAWDYERTERGVQIAPGVAVREARPQAKPSEVGGISFSCTIIPAKAWNESTLAPGDSNYAAHGFDHRFCAEARDGGARIVAMWGTGAAHLKGEDRAEVRLCRRQLLVVGDGEDVNDGPTWEVTRRCDWAEAVAGQGAEYLLVTGRNAHLTPAYVAALVDHLAWNPQFGAVWGYAVGADGRMSWGSGAGALLRLGALRGSNAGNLTEARTWLCREGWREEHTDRAHYHVQGPGEEFLRYVDPRREAAPYRVLMLNRDPYAGAQPGFGGDLTQIDGYRQGLRALGIYADLRTPDFDQHDGYHLVHLHHAQFEWAWQAAETCNGSRPVVLSTITHGRAPRWCLEKTVARANTLVAYSRSEAAYYAGLFPDKRIRVVPMGVNPALFSPNGDVEPEAAVFMCGKVCDYKGQLRVLEACKHLDVPVRFAGFNEDPVHDPYTDEFARGIAAYPKAEMLGFLRGEPLWDAYRRSHVHVNASEFEPFGQVTLDGLALGCNVVHSRESWAAEQFGRVGSLCDPEDVDSIASAIDTELKRRRGWANVRPPSWIEAAKAMTVIYAEALER